MFNPNY